MIVIQIVEHIVHIQFEVIIQQQSIVSACGEDIARAQIPVSVVDENCAVLPPVIEDENSGLEAVGVISGNKSVNIDGAPLIERCSFGDEQAVAESKILATDCQRYSRIKDVLEDDIGGIDKDFIWKLPSGDAVIVWFSGACRHIVEAVGKRKVDGDVFAEIQSAEDSCPSALVLSVMLMVLRGICGGN